MYHPRLGRFMQRDPIGTPYAPPVTVSARPTYAPRLAMPARPAMTRNISSPQFTRRDPEPTLQYADGMNLQQYARSNPIVGVDPSGQVLVVLSGAGQSEASMNKVRNATKTEIENRLGKWWPGTALKVKVVPHAKGRLTGEYDGLLRKDYEDFLRRRRKTPCSLEQFVAIGHSSGATAIYNEIRAGTFRPRWVNVQGYGRRRISPVHFGLIDMVLPLLESHDLFRARLRNLGFRTSMLHYKQFITVEIKGVKNINILKDHFSIVNDGRAVKGISEEAGFSYEAEVLRDRRSTRTWIKHTPHW